MVDPDELPGPAALQDERHDTVRGGDGQQVHHGGLDRDGDAPEGHQEQQHRQQHHRGDQYRDPTRDVGGTVDGHGGGAADVHLGLAAGECCGDDVGA